jgi:integrase
MAIREYLKDGKTLYEVYVHVKSNVDPLIRIQKRKTGIKEYRDAIKEETRISKEALREIGSREEKGGTWERIIELWYYDQFHNQLNDRYTNKYTIEDYQKMLHRYTKDWLKKRPSELTRGDGRNVIEKVLKLGKSKSFVLKVKNTINLVYQWGLDHRHIKDAYISPVHGVKIDKREDKFPEILNLTEIRTFLFEARKQQHEWYPIWAMALLTGMRSGELYALEWNDVDFENKLIRVTKSFNKRLNVIKSTKAGYWRNVPISEELNRLLVELKKITSLTNHVLPRMTCWDRGEQSKPLRSFLTSIGIPSVKFHTLRACFATQLLADGVEMTKVMKIGGWKDIKTMQIYLRLAGVDEKGATDGLRFLPSDQAVMGHVVELFSFKK